MKQDRFGRYIVGLVLATVGAILLVAGFNWFIDPYSVFGSPKINGVNALKPQVSAQPVLSKAYIVRRVKPNAIVLGTSRADVGIDPEHYGWSYSPVYNLSLSGANIYDITRYFQHANAIQPLRQVVLMLDFFSFDVSSGYTRTTSFESSLSVSYNGHPQSGFNILDTVSLTTSFDAFTASVETITHQTDDNTAHMENGMRKNIPLDSYGDYRESFMKNISGYLSNMYLPTKYDFTNPTPGMETPFEYYRTILRIAYQDDIDLRMAISPSHALQWETLEAVGLWTEFEYWKTMLVEINEDESLQAGVAAFPLWDFSGYSAYTTEPVPPWGDTSPMQGYWDSSHYKKVLGDLVLDCIFDDPSPDFGVLLTSDNIDSHLQNIRDDRQNYRNSHLSDIAEIEDLAKRLGVYKE